MKMDLLSNSPPYLLPVSIVATIFVLALSIIFTARNIRQIWSLGNPRKEDTKTTSVKDNDCNNEVDESEKEDIGAGGDGDNTVQEEDTAVRDPLEYCEHIQSEVKKAKQRVATKKIYPELTPEQLEEERRVQREQLQAIFKLMENQGGKFGIENIDDMQQQMKLYA